MKSTAVRSLSLRLLDLKFIRFGARYTESIYRSGLFPQVLFLPLSPLLSIISSLFSCSLLFLPFSLIPPLSSLLPSFSPFSLLSSLLSSVFSLLLLSFYLVFLLIISFLYLFSFLFSSSLPLCFSSSPLSLRLPSALCSLLSSYSYF